MIRSTAFIAIALCLVCTHAKAEKPNPSKSDISAIYEKFLDHWTDKEKDPVNVSLTAKTPSADDLKQFSDCADNASKTHWLAAEPIADLTNFIGELPYVHLVDPTTWSPRDPGKLIAQGRSVDSAVRSGFAHGLLTFSAIAFDSSGKTAAFTYSFVCGALCGNGGTVIFVHTKDGWSESTKQCGGWISYNPGDRPDNSSKPQPLRRSA